MKKELSNYLDLLRLTAALAVFVSHLSWARLTGGFLWQLQSIGHPAVIVFFVLSGFVIQYAAANKETTLYAYTVARFARLYSVVLPALILTFVCDAIGTHHNASVYLMDQETNPLERLFMGGLFLSQSWAVNLSLLSNDSFWSLPYEFWYYQMFAAANFFGGKIRLILIGVVGLIVGPAILLLFPVWLLGVAAYRISTRVRMDSKHALILWIASSLGVAVILVLRNEGIFTTFNNVNYLPPGFSIADYLMGALVAANIFAASYLKLPLDSLAKPIAAAAGVTFALYLFHLPLLFLAAAYIPAHWPVAARGPVAAIFVLVAVVALSFVTERRKQEWRLIFRRIFSRLATVSVKRVA